MRDVRSLPPAEVAIASILAAGLWALDQSGLMPANLITLLHLSVSAATVLAEVGKSAVRATQVGKRRLDLGSSRAALIRLASQLRAGPIASLRLDMGRPDDLAPFFGVFGDDLREIGRRAGQCSAADVSESRLDFWLGEPSVDLLVEPVDYLGRSVPGRADAVPRACLVAGHEVGDGRQVRQCIYARRAGHGQRPQPAGPDVLDRRCSGDENDVHLSTEHVDQRGSSAAVRNRN